MEDEWDEQMEHEIGGSQGSKRSVLTCRLLLGMEEWKKHLETIGSLPIMEGLLEGSIPHSLLTASKSRDPTKQTSVRILHSG